MVGPREGNVAKEASLKKKTEGRKNRRERGSTKKFAVDNAADLLMEDQSRLGGQLSSEPMGGMKGGVSEAVKGLKREQKPLPKAHSQR